jgi:hypothetical protein
MRDRFPPTTNRADWEFDLEVVDPDDGSLLDVSSYAITLQVRRQGTCHAALTATSSDGKITFPSVGIMRVRFPASEMKSLCPDT